MKRRQKAGFFSPYAPKSHQQRKRKGEKERARTRKGEEKKKAMVALLVSYNGYFGSSFGRLAVTFSKIYTLTNEDT